MNIKQLSLVVAVSALTFTTATNAVLGPIPIYLNTEYRTSDPVIGSIASVISLDSDAIQASGANTFLELLASIPSINLFNTQGNIPAVYLRGTESNHTLVLIDGIKAHDVSSPGGAASLDNISLDQIERIEIVKGPYSSLYGSNAIGGVIQVFTKIGHEIKDSTSINTIIGSNNTKRISFSSNHSTGKTSINANISNYSTDGISALTNNEEKDGVKQISANLNINYRISTDTSFNIGFLKTNTETEYDDLFGVLGSDPIEYKHNKLWIKDLTNNNLSIEHKFSDNWSSKLNVSIIDQNRQSLTDNIDDSFNTKSYKTKDLTLLNDMTLTSGLFTLGLSKIDDKNTTDAQSSTHKDIFTQWQGNIKGNDLIVGARNTNHTEFGNHTTYNLGLSKKINNDITASISHGTAFNAPSLYQLFAAWGTGNPNLTPEISRSTEISVRKQHSWGNSSVNLYKTKTNDLIDYSYDTYSYYNIDDVVNIKGVELSVNTNIMSWDISSNYNYLDAEKSNTTSQLLRRPKHSASISANKQSGKYNHRISLIQKSSSLDVGSAVLGGYTLVNTSTKYDYSKDTTLTFKAGNLLNKKYTVADGYNQIGRTINLGVIYKF